MDLKIRRFPKIGKESFPFSPPGSAAMDLHVPVLRGGDHPRRRSGGRHSHRIAIALPRRLCGLVYAGACLALALRWPANCVGVDRRDLQR